MNILELIKQLHSGNIVAFAVIVLSLIEFAPIKICPLSPLRWIGKRVNGETIDRLNKVESKLDEHIAQSYRNKILQAQNSLLAGSCFTKEEFDEIIDACENYEAYCKANKVPNEKCKLAISYIYHSYKLCQDNRSFANLPV